MSDVYKIKYVNDNKIEKIYVFFGDKELDDETGKITPQKLFKKNPNNDIFDSLFSSDEKRDIQKYDIEVVFSTESIHIDDTLETIKRKIIKELNSEVAFDEIYLFANQLDKLDSVKVYQNLTQDGRLELTKERFIQFLANVENLDITGIQDKEIYDYDDILSLNLNAAPHIVNIPIGQKFISVESNYPFTVNPYNVIIYDSFLEHYAEEITSTTNKNLLMDSGFIYENTIYLCLAEDVLKYAHSQSLSELTTTKIYFPYLIEKEIISISALKAQKQKLLAQNKKLLDKKFLKQVDNINLFYNIYKDRKTELDYIEQGIRSINFVLHPEYNFNLPLDIIFKLLHATRQMPFIKFNPAKRHEKIYRLYTDKIAKDGRKIPYLTKSTIFKLGKTIGKTKRVSAYIEYDYEGQIIPITCEFDSHGSIYINVEFKTAYDIKGVEYIVDNAVNPHINVVKNFLEQSGYNLSPFVNFYEPSVEIIDMKYVAYLTIKKNIHLNRIAGCVSSIFNIIVDNLKKGIVLRFKRVANYNEMDSQEAYIIEMINKDNEETDIVEGLMQNFQLTKEEAEIKIASLLNSLQVVHNL